MQKFFQDEKNMNAIDRLIKRLNDYVRLNNNRDDLRSMLGEGLYFIRNKAALFDEHCLLNIEAIGVDFIHDINAVNVEDNVEICDLFVKLYRFICEIEFNYHGDTWSVIRQIKYYVSSNIDSFSDINKSQIVFSNMEMPAQIVKKLIRDLAVNEIKKYNLNYQSLIDARDSLNQEFEVRKKAVEELNKNLQNQEVSYSFVTLVKGFHVIRENKEKERIYAFRSLLLLASLAFVPLLIELILFWFSRDILTVYKEIIVYVLPPLIALEVIVIYFFRVVLVHFKSVKAQLLQLDLRISLCQFIQSYSEYAQKMKKNDSTSLEKFESLIFSGIISNEENLPSTFDGADQLAKLVKALKG